MLTTAELSRLDVGGGAEDNAGRARACEWGKSGSHAIAIGIFDDLGIKDVTSRRDLTSLTIGRHKAVRGIGGGGICAIAIEVTESSRVDVQGAARGDEAKACEWAARAAELVEPKLP